MEDQDGRKYVNRAKKRKKGRANHAVGRKAFRPVHLSGSGNRLLKFTVSPPRCLSIPAIKILYQSLDFIKTVLRYSTAVETHLHVKL